MTSERRKAPSRSNVLGLRRRLNRVVRGASLLRRKREALVGELFRVLRPVVDARAAVAEEAQRAYDDLLRALAVRGRDELDALGLPERNVPVEIASRIVYGVEVPTITVSPTVVRTLALREVAAASAGPAAEQAATSFERLVERLVEAATREALVERVGAHLERTTRQVNVLEQRLAPALQARVRAMQQVLAEREREDHLRLRHLQQVGATRRHR